LLTVIEGTTWMCVLYYIGAFFPAPRPSGELRSLTVQYLLRCV
jgi:hypothetical protein